MWCSRGPVDCGAYQPEGGGAIGAGAGRAPGVRGRPGTDRCRLRGSSALDSADALRRDRVRLRWRRHARSDVRRRDATAPDRHRGVEGAGALRVLAVLRRDVRQPSVPLGREAGGRRGTAAAHVAAVDRVQAQARECLDVARRHVGAARLRRRAFRRARHRPVARLCHGRIRSGAARTEGGNRLAERTRPRVHNHRWRRRGRRDVVVDGQGRHDRDVLQRHDSTGRRRDWRQRTRSHHSCRAKHVVLPLLPVERSGAASRRMAG